MSLEVQGTLGGSAVTCDSKMGTVQNPAKCMLEQGSSFVVKIVANSIPPAGYSAWQTFLAYGELMYKPTTDIADEIVWPDSAFPLRVPSSPSGTEGNVKHGALNSLGPPPIPISTQVGSLVELQMNCQGSDRLVLLPLVPLRSFLVNLDAKLHSFGGPDGSAYAAAGPAVAIAVTTEGFLNLDLDNDGLLDNDSELIGYPVHTLIDVNCVEALAPPIGGVGLAVDLDALPLDSAHSSTGNRLLPAAMFATMTFGVIVLTGAAWFARRRWWRRESSLD